MAYRRTPFRERKKSLQEMQIWENETEIESADFLLPTFTSFSTPILKNTLPFLSQLELRLKWKQRRKVHKNLTEKKVFFSNLKERRKHRHLNASYTEIHDFPVVYVEELCKKNLGEYNICY